MIFKNMNGFSLKGVRVAVATVIFVAIVALFLDFTETVPNALHWTAHLQIVPAVLVGGVGMILLVFWTLLTLLSGRVYCSAVCPLGIVQDLVSRIAGLSRKKRGRYRFRPEMTKTRLVLLAVFLVSLPFFPLLVTLLDPYSNFGRIAASIFRPIYLAGNNLLARFFGSQAFYYRSIHVETRAVTVAAAALLLIGVSAALFGRRYCNTICPVGTLLGMLSRFSLLKIRLKSDCVSCGSCEQSCKGECIDSRRQTVDASRCVACFNCLGACKRGSILYSIPLTATRESARENPSDNLAAAVPVEIPSAADRRSFLGWTVFSLFLPSMAGSMGATKSSAPSSDPSLPTGVSRIPYRMTAPILPPGASDRKRFRSKCTACHLCVAKCPENILRPSTVELGLAGFLQPVVKFDHGFCNYDCTICTEVCPTRALTMLDTKEEKHRLQIGRVVFLKENCVVETQGSDCGACAEHCPTGAVTMVPYGKSEQALTIPVVDADLCVGCGACEFSCPVTPYRAIYVDGLEKHGEAKPAYDPDAKQEEVLLDDFGF